MPTYEGTSIRDVASHLTLPYVLGILMSAGRLFCSTVASKSASRKVGVWQFARSQR